jgi:hypothetical protein
MELKSSRSFLAIKHCQRTKSKIVIKRSHSSIYKAHRLIEHVWGFTESQWMPPSGECLRCIALVAAMVNEFIETTQNTTKTQFLASNYYGTFRALVVCENVIPQNRPSTQLIDATNFI